MAVEFLIHPAVSVPMDCVADADAEDAAAELSAPAVNASAPASIVSNESVMNPGEIIVWTAVLNTKELYTNENVLEEDGSTIRQF